MIEKSYRPTMAACCTGYIVQAIVCNFAPLLFLTFNSSYGIPLSDIAILITVNFGVQLAVDAASPGFIEKIGMRKAAILGNLFAAAGLAMLAFLPDMIGNSFTGLIISVAVYAIGGGLIEVLLSPIVEAIPCENKEGSMNFLHSFYCWGYVITVVLSTVFFKVFGIENWKILAVIWALVPFADALAFVKVPLKDEIENTEKGMTAKELISNKTFWIMALIMTAAGASELAVAQWASAFAESGLHVSKTMGDLLGPTGFAVMMGLARVIYIRINSRISVRYALVLCSGICILSYLLIAFSSHPAIGLAGCGLCGFGVGILWPATLSFSASMIPRGANRMFAYLALAGDIGCSVGPTVSGKIAGAFGDDLKIGIFSAIVFPIVLIIAVLNVKKEKTQQ